MRVCLLGWPAWFSSFLSFPPPPPLSLSLLPSARLPPLSLSRFLAPVSPTRTHTRTRMHTRTNARTHTRFDTLKLRTHTYTQKHAHAHKETDTHALTQTQTYGGRERRGEELKFNVALRPQRPQALLLTGPRRTLITDRPKMGFDYGPAQDGL